MIFFQYGVSCGQIFRILFVICVGDIPREAACQLNYKYFLISLGFKAAKLCCGLGLQDCRGPLLYLQEPRSNGPSACARVQILEVIEESVDKAVWAHLYRALKSIYRDHKIWKGKGVDNSVRAHRYFYRGPGPKGGGLSYGPSKKILGFQISTLPFFG